jgi:hypothetical protein
MRMKKDEQWKIEVIEFVIAKNEYEERVARLVKHLLEIDRDNVRKEDQLNQATKVAA